MNYNRSQGTRSQVIAGMIVIVPALAGLVYGSWRTTGQLDRSVANIQTGPYSETRLQSPHGG